MPGTLILHASLGTGHKSAAAALGEAFKRLGDPQVRVEDTLDLMSNVMSKSLQTYYTQSSEHGPKLYKLLYEASDKGAFEDAFSTNRLMGIIGAPFLGEFNTLIDEMNPDAIVCTMQIPLQLLIHRKQQGQLRQPLYVVVTDYVAHSTWFAPDVDGYFVPSDLTRDMMMRRGAPVERIHVTGIPVGLTITENKPMTAMRERHDLPTDLPVITLFGGGIEAERVRMIVSEMLEMNTNAVLAVVAGRNAELAEAIADLSDGSSMRLLKLGTIDYVDDLVAASDLVITKAGGLIISEVLARGTPMIIIDPLPGQEEWNADLVAASGAGVQLRMAEMVPPAAEYLINQLDQLMSMRRQAQKIGRPRAALDIAQCVLEETGRVAIEQAA